MEYISRQGDLSPTNTLKSNKKGKKQVAIDNHIPNREVSKGGVVVVRTAK